MSEIQLPLKVCNNSNKSKAGINSPKIR